MLDSYSDVLTINDTAEALRLSRRSVKRLMDGGDIRYRKIGRIYRISKKSVLAYLDGYDQNDKTIR
ncbi:MAG: helix-turn-helix domain-containing protein [Lachnospiraceae bacterium]|nr:helix-turn-helix domain-containing protein [Lachnospiraceae bacterium]